MFLSPPIDLPSLSFFFTLCFYCVLNYDDHYYLLFFLLPRTANLILLSYEIRNHLNKIFFSLSCFGGSNYPPTEEHAELHECILFNYKNLYTSHCNADCELGGGSCCGGEKMVKQKVLKKYHHRHSKLLRLLLSDELQLVRKVVDLLGAHH